MSEFKLYKDFDLSFTPHPLTGDIVALTDNDAIKQSLRNIVSFGSNDIPFRVLPTFSEEMLFEQADPIFCGDMQKILEWLIKSHEPRVSLNEVHVELSPDETAFDISVNYYNKSIYQNDRVEYTISRVR